VLLRWLRRRAEAEEERARAGRKARATIVDVGSSNVQDQRQSVVVRLRLEVREAGREPVGRTVAWEVQAAQLGRIVPGAELPVKIDNEDDERVYPGVGWAQWSETGRRR
jgi:hypothetical protein